MGSIYRRKKKRADGGYRELPTYWIKYRQYGRTVCETSGSTKISVARRLLRTREGDIEKGIPVEPRMGRVTFEEAAADLLNDYQVNGRKSSEHVKGRVDRGLSPAFKGKLMVTITTDVIRAYIATRQQEGLGNATINRELAALKRMFSLAIKAGKLHSKPHIPMLAEPPARKGFFERDQFEAVCSHLPTALQPLVRFGFLTGWRMRSEVFGLEWRQVDWEGRMVRLDPGSTKNGEGRSFPFTAELENLLQEQRAEHERWRKRGQIISLVFHRSRKSIRDIYGAWRAACRRAGVPGRHLHDFRRTAVRNFERLGISRSAGKAMVGHKTDAIYQRYAIADSVVLHEAAAKIDSDMGTLLGTPRSDQPKTRRRRERSP